MRPIPERTLHGVALTSTVQLCPVLRWGHDSLTLFAEIKESFVGALAELRTYSGLHQLHTYTSRVDVGFMQAYMYTADDKSRSPKAVSHAAVVNPVVDFHPT